MMPASTSIPSFFVVLVASIIGVFSAATLAVGFYQVLALPVGLVFIIILSAWLSGAPARAASMLLASILFYLVLSLVWPRYVALWLPGLPLINPQRVANFVILFVIFASFFSYQGFKAELKYSLSRFPVFWGLVGIFVFFRFISVIISQDFYLSIYQFLNEFFVHVVGVFLGVFLGSKPQYLKYFLFAIAASLVVSAGVGVVEGLLGKNLFASYVDPSNVYAKWAVGDKIRGGEYRVQSTFGHPLVFAEFAVVGFCLSLIFAWKAKWRIVRAAMVLFFLGCASSAVILSGSRSGYGALAISCTLLLLGPLVVGIVRKNISLAQATMWSFLIGFVVIGAILVGFVVYDHAFGSHSFQGSNFARLLMFTRSLDLIVASPFVGHGLGLAAEMLGIPSSSGVSRYTIDSLFVSYVVDSGVFAVGAFIGLLFIGVRNTWISAIRESGDDWCFWYAIAVALIAFFVSKIILSLPDNNFLLFMILGISVSRLAIESRVPVSRTTYTGLLNG